MFKVMMQNLRRIKILGLCAILLCLSVGFTPADAVENESTELPAPLSFKRVTGPQLIKNAVLIDTVDFELSESNPAITYPISETDSDLIFVFHDVSSSVNMSLIVGDGSRHCVGFHGTSNTIYARISPDLEYEFELSLGVISSHDMKRTETVDYCSGLLEIYQVAS